MDQSHHVMHSRPNSNLHPEGLTGHAVCTKVSLSSTVYDLGFLLDSQLTTKDHVSALCQSCFWQLRQLRLVRSSLTSDTAKTLVHAFISSRLDYCNSLLYGVGDGLLKKLQAVQNAAARVATGTKSSTTSRRCFVIFTGFQSAKESNTNWL